MKCSLRELAALTSSNLTDGRRGLDRPAARDRCAVLSQRMKTLFFEGCAASSASCGARKLHAVHNDPPVYVVPHFLTARELDHFDDLITCEVRALPSKQFLVASAMGGWIGALLAMANSCVQTESLCSTPCVISASASGRATRTAKRARDRTYCRYSIESYRVPSLC